MEQLASSFGIARGMTSLGLCENTRDEGLTHGNATSSSSIQQGCHGADGQVAATSDEARGIEEEKRVHRSNLRSQLLRPLYSPGALNWARNNRADLLKIEKKLDSMVTDVKTSSVQLKPMTAGHRLLVHVLARYYSCNSYEYDHEPKRYVSLVKTADTRVPSLLLSKAAQMPLFPLYPAMQTQGKPTIYFSLANSVYTKLGINLEKGNNAESVTVLSKENSEDRTLSYTARFHDSTEPSVSLNKIFTAEAGIVGSQVVSYVHAIVAVIKGLQRNCDEGNPMTELESVDTCGASTFLLTWKSEEASQEIWRRLQIHYKQHKSRIKELATMRQVPVFGRAHLMDLFEVEAGFAPREVEVDPEPEFPMKANDSQPNEDTSDLAPRSDMILVSEQMDSLTSLTTETSVSASATTGAAIRKHQQEVARMQASLVEDWADEASSEASSIEGSVDQESKNCAYKSSDDTGGVHTCKEEEEDPRFSLFTKESSGKGDLSNCYHAPQMGLAVYLSVKRCLLHRLGHLHQF